MQRRLLFVLLCLCLLAALPSFAQGSTPSVSVSNQISLTGRVMIDSVYSDGPGFVVIHVDNNGNPGRVAGFAAVSSGWTFNLEIPIDGTLATPTLFAMLHLDDGQVGVYEFDGQSGLDNPVSVDGAVVTPPFQVNTIYAFVQFISENKFIAAAVTIQQDGWLVIHSDNNGAPGPVLGQERILAGTTQNVEVEIKTDGRTPVLFPMLHLDTGTAGEYEFGTVQGADPPVVVRGVVATTPIWTVPHVRVDDQIVTHGDGGAAPNSSLKVVSVLSQGPGWLVIHTDNNGAPGPVGGFVAVADGLNTDLTVENLDASKLTPTLWPMLHVDTGTLGEYEFGTVQGADNPVTIDGNVLTFPINAAPALVLHDQDPLPGESDGTIRFVVDNALMDGPGWLAIHSNNNGAPGPVLTTARLHDGANKNLIIEVDAAAAGDLVFPMLHYDTGTIGEYEFGTVDGADAPVVVGGQVVVAPQRLTTAPAAEVTEAAPTAAPAEQTAAGTCSVSPRGQAVNRRSGPGTSFQSLGVLSFGESAAVIGQTNDETGIVWWQIDGGAFVRSDVVVTTGDCSAVPVVAADEIVPAAPAVAPPNATEESS